MAAKKDNMTERKNNPIMDLKNFHLTYFKIKNVRIINLKGLCCHVLVVPLPCQQRF